MLNRVRICFVQSDTLAVFNPKSGAKIGGAEIDLYNIATELIKDNRFEIYFLVADFGQAELEIYNQIRVVKGHSRDKSIKSIILSLIIFYRRLAEINADIYLTANHSKYVGLTSFFCKINDKIHIHRTEHQDQVNKMHNLKKAFKLSIRYIFFLLGFINVDHIVVQNEEDKQMLKKSYGFPSTVIKNSYPIKKAEKIKKNSILWVARGENWKRPEIFIKLAKAFPNDSFIMIMPTADDKLYFEKIKIKAEKLDNLKFIPGVSFLEIEKYYDEAKIFINTSISEGFPNSFNQAMNSSTPILSLNINPDNFIQKNQVGLFANNEFEKLKECLSRLLKDRDLWNRLSENAYNYVNSEMNIEKTIIKWKKILFYFLNKI